jgi:hypothetical protein
MEITISDDPGIKLADIELRSDEMVVLMGGQPLRISKDLCKHLYAIVSAVIWAKHS